MRHIGLLFAKLIRSNRVHHVPSLIDTRSFVRIFPWVIHGMATFGVVGERMGKLTSLVFLASVGVCAPAFAQSTHASSTTSDAPTQAQVDRMMSTPRRDAVLSPLGWAGVGTAATGLALFGWSFADIQPSDFNAADRNSMLWRRATGAVVTAVGSGLVLIDLAGKRSDSCLYVKFGSDGMPRLRWRTRF